MTIGFYKYVNDGRWRKYLVVLVYWVGIDKEKLRLSYYFLELSSWYSNRFNSTLYYILCKNLQKNKVFKLKLSSY